MSAFRTLVTKINPNGRPAGHTELFVYSGGDESPARSLSLQVGARRTTHVSLNEYQAREFTRYLISKYPEEVENVK